MPFVSIVKQLRRARTEGFGVPLFNIFEMSLWPDLMAVVQNKRAPAIAGLWVGESNLKGKVGASVHLAHYMAAQVATPVSLMLDHGASAEHCFQALSIGFTDVMFDGSKLPIDENIAITRSIVKAAHAVGAGVEAELGHVGLGGEYADADSVRRNFTNPDDVERFVAETGVDMLAIAIGTAHGIYTCAPRLDFERLKQIGDRVDIPLVLHGGTGLSEEQFRKSIQAGIAKINVVTDLYERSKEAMTGAAASDKASYFSIMESMHGAFQERCGHYLDLFGAAGRS